MKFAVSKLENGNYMLVRSEKENENFFVPFSGLSTKHRFIERKTIKSIINWLNKHGCEVSTLDIVE